MEEKSETITKVFDDIKNRFSSRFIFSFIFFWLIFNWRIIISLLWYDTEQINLLGFKTLHDFIENELKSNSKLCHSIFSALIFTFLLPLSKSLINIYDSLILEKRNFIKSKILKDALKDKIKSLKEIIENINEYSILNGEWEIEYKEKDLIKDFEEKKLINFGTFDDERLRIKNSNCYKDYNGKEKLAYIIENFYYNATNNKVTFLKKSINEKDNEFFKSNKLNILRFTNEYEKDTLEGFENGVEIKYKKIKNL